MTAGCGAKSSSTAIEAGVSQSAQTVQQRASAFLPPARRVRGTQPTYTSRDLASAVIAAAAALGRAASMNRCRMPRPSAR
jgi:hypothetical protein